MSTEIKLEEIATKIEQIEANNAVARNEMLSRYNEMSTMFMKLMAKAEAEAQDNVKPIADMSNKNDHLNRSVDQDELDEFGADDSLASSVIINRKCKITAIPPPPFAGDMNGAGRVKAWVVFKAQLQSFFDVLMMNGSSLDDSTKVSLLVPLLRSPALDHVIGFKNKLISKSRVNKIDFGVLLKEMDNMYQSTSIEQSSYDDLFTLRQADGESVVKYFEKFIHLMQEANSEDENQSFVHKNVATNCFTNGLFEVLQEKVNERKTADGVLNSYRHDQAHEAVLHCCKIALNEEQRIIKSGKSWLLKRRSTPPNNPRMNINQSRPVATPQQATRVSSNYVKPSVGPTTSSTPTNSIAAPRGDRQFQPRGPSTCFNCNGRGHIAKYCPKTTRASLNMFSALGGESEDEKEETQSKK